MCSPGDREEGELGDTIEALQRVALYLGPQDEWYEEVGACSLSFASPFHGVGSPGERVEGNSASALGLCCE